MKRNIRCGLAKALSLCIPLALAAFAEEKSVPAPPPAPVTQASHGAEAAVVQLTQDQLENIVRRSYQYVAAYNVNNKFAKDPDLPNSSGGRNKVKANTAPFDHTVQAIARPNNDTLYIGMMLDLRKEPVIIDLPAFDSKYVSLMVTA